MKSPSDVARAYAEEDAERHRSAVNASENARAGATFTFVDVSYAVPLGRARGQKVILQNVSGAAIPGEVLALLGPSGSGKTSLLNVLAGRAPAGGTMSGEILVDGKPRSEKFMRERTAYVMQEELLFPFLTVTETLMLHCKLRRGSLSDAEIETVVREIIGELGLTKVAKSFVGKPGGLPRGISGGERKRVNIGVEMVSDPEALFLDEPTSGLDSFQALRCVTALRQLASQGRTIVCTIHQPRSSIFAMFARLLLISEGRLLYIGDATDALEYFASLSFDCPNLTTPSDFYMDITSVDTRNEKREKSSRERIEFFADEALARALGMKSVNRALQCIRESDAAEQLGAYYTRHAGWFMQFALLVKRSIKLQSRDFVGVGVTVAIELIYALIVSALFRNVGMDQKGVQDRIGCLFFVVLNVAYTAALPAINIFAGEKSIVIRERASGAYVWSSYYLSKYVGELPKLLPRLLFCSLVYWIVGLRNSVASFWIFVVIIVAEAMSLMALGLLMASSMPVGAALALGPACITIFTLFGGIYLNIESIPDGAKWIRFIDPIYYAYSALVANEFGGDVTFLCDSSARCLENGQAVLELYAFDNVNIGIQVMAQMILQAGIHVLAFLALVHTSKTYAPLFKNTRPSNAPLASSSKVVSNKDFQTV